MGNETVAFCTNRGTKPDEIELELR
jgi:hypothetical protein